MIRRNLILVFFILAFFNSIGQVKPMEKELIDSLVFYEQKLTFNIPEKIQKHANERIKKLLPRLIGQENSINFNLDTFKIISVLTSNDKKLRVFSWVCIEPMGIFNYFGFVQSYDEKAKQYKTIELTDRKTTIESSMKKTFTPENWYGARYYQLIQTRYKRKNYYTLLGWKGLDMTQNASLIDVISLKSNGTISFGYNIFEIKESEYFKNSLRPKRVIYAYSSEAHMILTYQRQTILKKISDSEVKKAPLQFDFAAQKKEVRTKEKFKKIEGEMIVLDRLAPLNPDMEGMYSFYIPTINILDAFYFESGKWYYFPDIDARNTIEEKEQKEIIYYDLLEEKIEEEE